MVLESGGVIGLGEMARVVGLRGQAEVGQAQLPDEASLLEENGSQRSSPQRRVPDHESEEEGQRSQDEEEGVGPAHRLNRDR